MLTGQKLTSEHLSPSLKTGVTFACFSSDENPELVIDILKLDYTQDIKVARNVWQKAFKT